MTSTDTLRENAGRMKACAILIEHALDAGDTPEGYDYLGRARAVIEPTGPSLPPGEIRHVGYKSRRHCWQSSA